MRLKRMQARVTYRRLSFSAALFFLFASPLQLLLKGSPQTERKQSMSKAFLGFDRNIYPGDDALRTLRKSFAFAGYWLSPPPGETVNTWRGKRSLLQSLGFGFALLYRARQSNELPTESEAAKKGLLDARAAAASAKTEGFSSNVLIFLDVEEGGRLPAPYHAYLHAWAEELSRRSYRPGVYCSGIPVDEGGSATIITASDIREHLGSNKLSYWIYNDVCPPSPGCSASPPAPAVSLGGVNYATLWQFVQSPRRKEFTAQCATSYHSDGNCYAPGDVARVWFLDLNTATSPDPSGEKK